MAGWWAAGAMAAPEPLRPRLCLLVRGEHGYGFHLHGEKGRRGQFIRRVEPDSPAEAAALRAGDRLVEVNGVNVEGETHHQVGARNLPWARRSPVPGPLPGERVPSPRARGAQDHQAGSCLRPGLSSLFWARRGSHRGLRGLPPGGGGDVATEAAAPAFFLASFLASLPGSSSCTAGGGSWQAGSRTAAPGPGP